MGFVVSKPIFFYNFPLTFSFNESYLLVYN